MNKIDNILDYYMGTKAYTLFLQNLLYEDVRGDFILDKRNIIAAKVGLISNILLGIKEDIVRQDELGSYSRLYENELENSVSEIAKKTEDGYVIDNYHFKNAAEVVTEIRNRIAHGNFLLDLDNNRIILQIREQDVRINITKLSVFICNSLKLYITLNNNNEFKRDVLISRKVSTDRTKPITKESELKGLLRTFKKTEFTLKRKDGKKIEPLYIEMLERIIKNYRIDSKIDAEVLTKFQSIIKDDYIFECKNISTDGINYDEITKELIKQIPINVPYNKQVYMIGFELQRKLDTRYSHLNPIVSNIKNLILLEEIYKNGTINNKTIEKKVSKRYKMLYVNYDLLASAAMSMFNSLFSYANDDIYKNPNKYTKLPLEGLDYSKLDLNKVVVENLQIETTNYESLFLELKDKKKELNTKNKKIKEVQNNINIVKNKGNITATQNLTTILETIKEEKTNIEKEITKVYQKIITLEEYYRDNYTYLRNESIINGIRNSIAHGGYKVEQDKNTNYNVLVFENTHNGQVTFRAKVELLDFINIVNYNSPEIINLVNEKTPSKRKIKLSCQSA